MHLAVLHGLGALGTAVLPGPESSPGGHAAQNAIVEIEGVAK